MIKSLFRFVSKKYQNVFLDYPVQFQPRYGHGKPAHDLLYGIINANREIYRTHLFAFLEYEEQFKTIQTADRESDINQPAWNNGMLPGLDIVGIYGMLAKYKPKKYVEVGSGNSTKVAYKAKTDLQLSMEIVSIDPVPRAEIDHLADKVIRAPFETIEYQEILDLEENDILFIDNSHRILPNSDATVFFLEILPKLKKGVIVQVHDVYLPYDYPQFMCDRAYSEQYGLAFYLLANPGKYNTVLPNFFISEDKELCTILTPLWKHDNLKTVEQHGGSFWFQIKT